MTIDERLKFLLESTESLHAQMQQVFVEQARQRREEVKHRRAVLTALQAYLQALDNGQASE